MYLSYTENPHRIETILSKVQHKNQLWETYVYFIAQNMTSICA